MAYRVPACRADPVSAGPPQVVVRVARVQGATPPRAMQASPVWVARAVPVRPRPVSGTVAGAAGAAGSSAVAAEVAGRTIRSAAAVEVAAEALASRQPTATGVGVGSLSQDDSGNGQAEITPAQGICPKTLTVSKAVQGGVPAGTIFTVHVQCSHPMIASVSAQASPTTVDEDLFFDAAGHATNGTNPTISASRTTRARSPKPRRGARRASHTCAATTTRADRRSVRRTIMMSSSAARRGSSRRR